MSTKLRELRLKSGETISVADGLTVIVGPNNSGKSVLLRELNQHLGLSSGQQPMPPFIVLDSCDLKWIGSYDELEQKIRSLHTVRPPGQYTDGLYYEEHIRTRTGVALTFGQIRQAWNSDFSNLGILAQLFNLYLDAQGRLGQGLDGQAFNPHNTSAVGIAQVLYDDRDLEKHLSSVLKRAFGKSLTVNRYASPEITVHVGEMTEKEVAPPQTKEYIYELNSLPRLSLQGDGFRAFTGMIFTIMFGQYSLVIIDEPEAFLHPPQAYLLGKMLAEQAAEGVQIVVATHSADIVKGITAAKSNREISIARITRKETINHVSNVTSAEVRALYDDPLVRYYPIVDGLFAKGVIICEADSDCTYYRAALEAASEDKDKNSIELDVHFSHCGGKSRVGNAAKVLRAAEVPVASILDIDLLRGDKEFNEIVTAHGGNPEDYKTALTVIRDMVNSWSKPVTRISARAEIKAILDSKEDKNIVSSDVKRITEALGGTSGWRRFKSDGMNGLSGDALKSFKKVDEDLRSIGIFIVPFGELECFHREISATNKPEWLRKVLESEAYKGDTEARKFVTAVVKYLEEKQ
ncbi:ATP-dependent nuclease [Amycolatopsis sp. NPDC051758]|uniref:ATP-dependent nuclease n=1 Tax=Amycolatopsis sp. NPDC051758 TaxID=3363935 RepID=UPI00378A30C1